MASTPKSRTSKLHHSVRALPWEGMRAAPPSMWTGLPSYRRPGSSTCRRPCFSLGRWTLVQEIRLPGRGRACSRPWTMAVRGNLAGSVSPRSASGVVAASAFRPSYMRCVDGFLQSRVAPKNSRGRAGAARGRCAGLCLPSVIRDGWHRLWGRCLRTAHGGSRYVDAHVKPAPRLVFSTISRPCPTSIR